MKTLNDFFDNIYCINLAHRADRWEDVSKEFAKHLLIVERVEAVNGKEVFREGLNRHAGAYGLVLTNIKIFEDAISKGYMKILILEDDIKFAEDVNEKFWKKMQYLPDDWNMLYLGGNSQFTWGKFDMVSGDKSVEITKKNYNTFDYELVRTRHTQSSYAIGFNKKTLVDFLEKLRATREPIDVLQTTLQKTLYKTYVFLPTLVKHIDGYSDITNMFFNYSESDANNF